MSNNRPRIGLNTVVVFVGGILFGVIAVVLMERSFVGGARTSGKSDKLTHTLQLIENRYVDEISRDSLAEFVLPELISKLDPHSGYIPAAMFQKVIEPLTGQFDGIGVMFNTITDTALITNVISGGPSDKAGVVAGDRIITVNDTLISGVKINSDDIVKKLRGKRGTKVRIGVLRNGAQSGALTQIEITRGIIPMKSLDASFMIDNSIGYIKFSRFAATTYREIMETMEDLTDAGAKSFILDMRDNSGGYLDQAILISNEFLEKGQKIVYTEGAHSPRREQLANGSGRYKDVPLTIILDEFSASASEILAGAIQDNDRGIIVGRRSFGKGLVQEQIDYKDGSTLRLTVARYYTPLGRSIQKPYKMGRIEEYYSELKQRAEHDEFFNADSVKQNQNMRFETPKGRILYGGGGIMPDEFVPMDTVGLSKYFRQLFAKNLIFKFATNITEQNRNEINQIKNYGDLDKFYATRDIYSEFVRYAAQNGVVSPNPHMDENRTFITLQLKGYIGRNTEMSDGAYYYYVYPEDKTVIRAISTLKK